MAESLAQRIVVFCGFRKPEDEHPTISATAFFVVSPSTPAGGLTQAAYLVTARHVIESIARHGDGFVWIRFNVSEGSSAWGKIPLAAWRYHVDSRVDIAAIRVRFAIPNFNQWSIRPAAFLRENDVVDLEIRAGDETITLGLFKQHYGRSKNIPVMRCGNIAALPEEKIETDHLGKVTAYLIESRSIGGLSGSPVWVLLDPSVPADEESVVRMHEGSESRAGRRAKLLGLVHGHFEKLGVGLDHCEIDSMVLTENLRVNIGIAIVIPAFQILEVLDQEFETQVVEIVKAVED